MCIWIKEKIMINDEKIISNLISMIDKIFFYKQNYNITNLF